MPRRLFSRLIIPLITTLGLLVTLGCRSELNQLLSTPEAELSQPDTPTPTAPPARTPNTAADTIADIPEPAIVTLTLWLPEQFSGQEQDQTFLSPLSRFETEYPDIKVETIFKRTSGQASAINFLRVAKPVAPTVMPDVVVLNTDDLLPAWRGQLIQPLDGLLDRTVVQDLLPAAKTLGTVDNNLIGIPFELTVEHLVFNTSKVLTTPITWSNVISYVPSYQFAADGQKGLLNDSLLIQYLSTEARLTNDQGEPIIDETALRALLNYYQTLRDDEIIQPSIIDPNHTRGIWDNYLAGLIGMTHVSSRQYLSNRRLLVNTQAAPIPSLNGSVVTVGHGWAFVLVTNDPIRQNAALKLIEHYLHPDINAAWATHSMTIPTRQTAFDQLAGEDTYWTFLRGYLDATQPPPSFTGYDQLSRILLVAIQQIIQNAATPDEAIDNAIQDLAQSTS